MNTEVLFLPEQPIQIDQITEYDGKQYQAIKHFSIGKEARNSGIKVFINTPRGVMGMTELTQQ